MAGPLFGSSPKTSPIRSPIVRCIAIVLLVLLVIVGLIVLITWLAIKPKKLVYTIETGKVEKFDLHLNNLNATFDFVLRAHNPNKKASVYYDSIEVSVLYDDEPIAFQMVEPFFQPHKNVTMLDVKPMGLSVPIEESVSKDIGLEKSSGEIQVEVRVKARIRFKVGKWKSSHYTLKVKCYHVEVHVSSPKQFHQSECHVDI